MDGDFSAISILYHDHIGLFKSDDITRVNRSPVAEAARKHKVSEQIIYVWRQRFGKLDPADVKRVRALEAENAKLKKIVAERDLRIDTLKEVNRRKW